MKEPFIFSSQGFQSCLWKINKSGKSVFPSGWNARDFRLDEGQNLRTWFVDCVNECFSGQPDQCCLEKNVAVFLDLVAKDNIIVKLSCQVVAVSDKLDLEDLYLDNDIVPQYFRLDYHPHELGPLFKEGLPHIHTGAYKEPRIPFIWCRTDNIIIEFFDFLCRNFCYENWLFWVESIWGKHLAIVNSSRPNNFEKIKKAFGDGDLEVLSNKYKDEIDEIKQCIGSELSEWGETIPVLKMDEVQHLIYEK